MTDLKVEKKDGRLESFDRNKVVSSATKAGASNEQSESIASQIETWAYETAVDSVIKTSSIREKVLELLRPMNPQAATAFETYIKEKNQQ
ncbi:hypothetical protein JW766_06075 [Candidatus Dojkabacteria bacterium]|nr:hypothetical protein [Candidatus Dojkabacteria bacterium]